MFEKQNSVQAHLLKHTWRVMVKEKAFQVGTKLYMGQELRESQAAALGF